MRYNAAISDISTYNLFNNPHIAVFRSEYDNSEFYAIVRSYKHYFNIFINISGKQIYLQNEK
jgi:hypothetical protein